MPERDPHSDNELIDSMSENAAPSQQSTAGGDVAKTVGSRAEEDIDPEGRERATGADNPAQDEEKGSKTRQAIKQDYSGS